MFELSPLNILFIILSISVFLITIFLCMALYHVIQILREAEEVIDKANNTVDQINTYIAKPIKIAMEVSEKVRYAIGLIQKHYGNDDDE